MAFPATPLRPGRLTNRVRNVGNSYSNIQTDNGLIAANDPEQLLKIIGSGGIIVSGVEGSPDTITISLDSSVIPEDWVEDEYIPTDNQISFLLTRAPSNPDSVFFIINGVTYDDLNDYTVSGQTITWTNSLFVISSDDKVVVKYY